MDGGFQRAGNPVRTAAMSATADRSLIHPNVSFFRSFVRVRTGRIRPRRGHLIVDLRGARSQFCSGGKGYASTSGTSQIVRHCAEPAPGWKIRGQTGYDQAYHRDHRCNPACPRAVARQRLHPRCTRWRRGGTLRSSPCYRRGGSGMRRRSSLLQAQGCSCGTVGSRVDQGADDACQALNRSCQSRSI